MCGVCCTVFDVAHINKKQGERCRHLDENNLCKIHETKPWACSGVQPDELCVLISDLSEEDKIKVVKKVYGVK